ncbi:hypothetical protein [Marimonas arenosa]|uniref:Uncharacterized protein n=1 Tax=Marimonas arenosa TaxID=1795305 RepID=A0AAE3WFS5_9RHOB|nr:hypothetical protein [Marimonas arenosa]MDQ2092231.1 hypothetical protein [Marimonas arenosa]
MKICFRSHAFRTVLVALAAAGALNYPVTPAYALDTFSTGVNINDGGDTTSADLFVTDVSVLDGKVCIGNGCVDAETFENQTLLKLRAANPTIEFFDTSSVSYPDRDWSLLINDTTAGGPERFAVQDRDSNTIPFTIEGTAPTNALYVDFDGRIGLGTSEPSAELHVVDGNTATLRLEQDGSYGFSVQTWDIAGNEASFFVMDATNGSTMPFRIETGAPTNAIYIENDSDIGMGTSSPNSALHIRRLNGSAKILVEENSATAPRTLLELQNNGRPEIVMANNDTGGEWSFGAGTNFILKQGAVGSASSAKTKLFEIQPTGDAVLTGSLTTGGTTCGGGCDRVFSQDYDLPSIAEHADRMFSLGHLPNVGPTPEGAPFNLTDKLGRMLNELEHAHIYIAELERQVRRIPALEADRDALEMRVRRLEVLLGGQVAD